MAAAKRSPRAQRKASTHTLDNGSQAHSFGTLLDHDYEWIRQGAKGTTRPVYLLEPLEKAKLPKELADLYASLPDLEDVAFDRVEKPEPKKERVGDAFEAELARVEVEENPFGTSSKNVTTEDSEDPF